MSETMLKYHLRRVVDLAIFLQHEPANSLAWAQATEDVEYHEREVLASSPASQSEVEERSGSSSSNQSPPSTEKP